MKREENPFKLMIIHRNSMIKLISHYFFIEFFILYKFNIKKLQKVLFIFKMRHFQINELVFLNFQDEIFA